MNRNTFYHWLAPLLVLGTLFVLSISMGWDVSLADQLYQMNNGWTLRRSWLLSDVIHDGGRKLTTIMELAIILLLIVSNFVAPLRKWRGPLGFLVFCTLVSLLIISGFKQVAHINCPWDFVRYGGDLPDMSFMDELFGDVGDGKCFPAGHASAGYAWFALYFMLRAAAPKLQYWGLLIPVVLGGVFGVAQQLRGAHFFTHDIATILICWYLPLIVATFCEVKKSQKSSVTTCCA